MYKNFKKIFASATAVAVVASQALTAVVYGAAGLNDPEFDSALTWMYENKLTSYNTSDAYRPFDTLTREQAAKFYVGFAQSLWLKADETKDCTFSDTAEMDSTLSWAVVESCKLGLFKGSNGKFMPTAAMTKAAALTVLVRAMAWAQDENVDPWWSNYFAKAQELGLTKETDVHAIDREVTRYEISLMLYRASGEKTSGNSSSDLSDLLSGLLGDSSSSSSTDSSTSSEASTSTGSTVEEKVVEVRKSDVSWDLMEVTLNPDTPTYSRLPASADGVNVAIFDLAAWDNDVTINSIVLKRVWDGAANGITAIALYDDYGRISKSKTFNSSDDTSTVFFTPALVVKAGEIKKLAVYGTMGLIANKWAQFAMQIVSIDTETKVSSDLPLTANLMELGSTTASNLQIDADGSISNPKLGETTKTIAKFKMKNSTINSEDITVQSITLKEDGTSDEQSDLRNLILKCGGTEIAKVSGMTSKYLTFEPKDGILVKESKSLSCEITADVVWGATKTVSFLVERDIDIVAQGSKYKGINVSDYSSAALSDKNVSGGGITIQAWELTIVTEEPSATEFRKNKKDIILWKLKVTSNAGKAIELQKIQVKLIAQTANSVSTYMENVELYDETAWVTYDLSSNCTAPGNDYLCHDNDLTIAIPETGTKIFQIRADSKNTAWLNVNGYKFNVQLSAWNGTNGYYFVSTQDDKQVTDVTPSSVSFKNMEGKSSTATVTVLPMSTTKNAVIWAKDVEVAQFEVAADNSSALTMDRVIIAWTVVDASVAPAVAGTASLDNTRISALYLYKDGETSPLKRVSGSNIASNKATFDGFTVSIAKNAKQKFIVKADFVDDTNQSADTVQFSVAWYRLQDEDNDDVYLADELATQDWDLSNEAAYVNYKSARITTITWAWSLALTVDNTDSATDKAKNVLGNTTSDFVASYEATATNEDVKIKDLQVIASSAQFVSAVSEIIIYKNDKTTEIDRESVSGQTVTFTNINYIVAQGSENLYVKVKTRKIGKDEAWIQSSDMALTMKVTSAEGSNSGKVISSIDHDSTVALVQAVTANSNSFKVVPVKISAISFVNSQAWETVASSLQNGENTVAIIAVTSDSSTNTKDDNGASLKLELESMNMTVNTDAWAWVTALTVQKINGTASAQSVAKWDGTPVALATINADWVNLFRWVNLWADEEMNNGETVYFVVKATLSWLAAANNKYFQLKLDNLDSGSTVEYSSNNSDDASNAYDATDNITSLRIWSTSISGPSISSRY